MKSYAQYLQGLYSAILASIAVSYPSLRRDCERDASRLLSLIESRGLPFLMMDLPDAGKHFERSLSNGHLTSSGIAGQRPYSRKSPIPRLFKGLFLRVFDNNGALRVDADAACIRHLRQLFYAAKKMKVSCSDSRTWEHVDEFFRIDQEVRQPSLNWGDDELRIDRLQYLHLGDTCRSNPTPLFDAGNSVDNESEESLSGYSDGLADAIQRTADAVTACLGIFNPRDWRAKHGPGAVADQNHTQFKYDFPNWPAKLSHVFPLADFGFSNFGNWATWAASDEAHNSFLNHEPPSRLIAVPKTLKGPRLIASEPVSHQWCQQTIKDYLTSRLSNTPIVASIHFRDQTYNQELARLASHTQSHATIDLSSASDRLSCWLVERIFRRSSSLVAALHASRTRWVVNTIDRKSPKYHVLRKFACMGSACTFPVQSYVFAIITIGCVLYARRLPVTLRTIRTISQEVLVFGDDIIVPTDCWVTLQGTLSHLGLKVNQHKSFGIGKFRESCGFDAYDGHDVTPTYSMTYPEVSRPESIISCVATHNNFVMKGLYGAAAYIKSTVASLGRFRISNVPIGSGAFGWYDHEHLGNSHLKSRWNSDLHRVEYQCDVAHARSQREPIERDSSLLQYFTEVHSLPRGNEDRLGVAKRTAVSIRRRWVPSTSVDV